MESLNPIKILRERLHWQGYFLLFVILFMFALTGQGHSVTYIMARNPPHEQFMVWGAWITFLVGMVGALCSGMYWWRSKKPSRYTTILIFITIIWTWAGGVLDFLHFMMVGSFPPVGYVWEWMPFYFWLDVEWTIIHQAIYTLFTTILLIIGWIIEGVYRKRKMEKMYKILIKTLGFWII